MEMKKFIVLICFKDYLTFPLDLSDSAVMVFFGSPRQNTAHQGLQGKVVSLCVCLSHTEKNHDFSRLEN